MAAPICCSACAIASRAPSAAESAFSILDRAAAVGIDALYSTFAGPRISVMPEGWPTRVLSPTLSSYTRTA